MGEDAVHLRINGRVHALDARPGASLLHVLRNDLNLNGPKFGCGLGECGACTVLIDGRAARSCALPAETLGGLDIVTLEGLAEDGVLNPVQQAFIANSATQCGYCLNGMIMTVVAFLKVNPDPCDAEIAGALRYNLCRCGSHLDVIRAAGAAAHSMRGGAR